MSLREALKDNKKFMEQLRDYSESTFTVGASGKVIKPVLFQRFKNRFIQELQT